MIWRDDGDTMRRHVGGTGSISCLGITEEQGRAAEACRGPLGFQADVDAVIEREAALLEDRVLAALSSWGECGWTARDCLTIVVAADGSKTLR